MTNNSFEKLKEVLAGSGLKATHQRMVILQTLKDSKEHPSAEVIHERLKISHPTISLGTVYKTLETFVDSGLINRVNTSQGNMRYDGLTEQHDHIYCTNTNEIIDFKDQELSEMITEFFKKKKISNFDLKNIRLHISGEKIDINKDVRIK